MVKKIVLMCSLLSSLIHSMDVSYKTKAPVHEQQSSDLLTAVRFKSVEEIRTILKNKPRVNFKDTYGDTVLHKAAWRRDLDILRLILTLDVDLNCRSNQGETPLHLAAKRKWEDGVKVM